MFKGFIRLPHPRVYQILIGDQVGMTAVPGNHIGGISDRFDLRDPNQTPDAQERVSPVNAELGAILSKHGIEPEKIQLASFSHYWTAKETGQADEAVTQAEPKPQNSKEFVSRFNASQYRERLEVISSYVSWAREQGNDAARILKEDVVPFLITIIRHGSRTPDPTSLSLQLRAAGYLGSITQQFESAEPEFVQAVMLPVMAALLMHAESGRVSKIAEETLVKIAPQSVPYLVAHLAQEKRPEPVLEFLKDLSPVAYPTLTEAMGTNDTADEWIMEVFEDGGAKAVQFLLDQDFSHTPKKEILRLRAYGNIFFKVRRDNLRNTAKARTMTAGVYPKEYQEVKEALKEQTIELRNKVVPPLVAAIEQADDLDLAHTAIESLGRVASENRETAALMISMITEGRYTQEKRVAIFHSVSNCIEHHKWLPYLLLAKLEDEDDRSQVKIPQGNIIDKIFKLRQVDGQPDFEFVKEKGVPLLIRLAQGELDEVSSLFKSDAVGQLCLTARQMEPHDRDYVVSTIVPVLASLFKAERYFGTVQTIFHNLIEYTEDILASGNQDLIDDSLKGYVSSVSSSALNHKTYYNVVEKLAPHAIKALAESLGDYPLAENFVTRQLILVGKPAIPVMLEIVRNEPNEAHLKGALRGLNAFGRHFREEEPEIMSEQILPVLLDHVRHENKDVRGVAITLVKDLPGGIDIIVDAIIKNPEIDTEQKRNVLEEIKSDITASDYFFYELVLELDESGMAAAYDIRAAGLMPTPELVERYQNGIVPRWQQILENIRSGRLRFDSKNALHAALVYTDFRAGLDLCFSRPTKFTYETYLMVLEASQAGDESSSNLSSEQRSELVYAGFEAFKVYQYLMDLKEQARQEGRKIFVVPNYSYGRFVAEPLEQYLRGDDIIEIVPARIGSTECHTDEYLVHARATDRLFSPKIEKQIMEEQPMIVMVDGSNSYSRGRHARYPDAQKGFVNFAIALNDALGVEQGEMYRDEEHYDGLRSASAYSTLVDRLQQYDHSQTSAESYNVFYWNPAGTDLALTAGKHSGRAVVKKVPVTEASDVTGPALVVINSVFNDGHQDVAIPDDVRHMAGGIQHESAYFDDTSHIQNILFRVGSRGIEIQDNVFGHIQEQFRRFLYRDFYETLASTGIISFDQGLKLRLHRLHKDRNNDPEQEQKRVRHRLSAKLERVGLELEAEDMEAIIHLIKSTPIHTETSMSL